MSGNAGLAADDLEEPGQLTSRPAMRKYSALRESNLLIKAGRRVHFTLVSVEIVNLRTTSWGGEV